MKKFIIVGVEECGAAPIAQLLASDLHSYVFGELFHHKATAREKEASRKTIGGKVVDPIFSCYQTFFHENANSGVYTHNFLNMPTIKANSIGFLIYYSQLEKHKEAKKYLASKKDIHLIYALRNPLHALADRKMKMTGDNQVYLSSTFCYNYFGSYERNKARIELIFEGHPTLTINLPEDYSTCIQSVNTFLGTNATGELTPYALNPELHIANFNLLRTKFLGSPYKQYFKSQTTSPNSETAHHTEPSTP